ncbi:MAG: BrnT family toxin [Clostridia bacterium]|nr:MAG: BrnT family toxin [Clostridia bacterium]
MNFTYTLHNVRFEWNIQKYQDNLRKHRVSFETACETFFDPFVHWLEEEVVHDERRETIIGMTEDWTLLFVVYVLRNDVIRLISAREVTHAERKRYENQ